jgi:hypothetical protein
LSAFDAGKYHSFCIGLYPHYLYKILVKVVNTNFLMKGLYLDSRICIATFTVAQQKWHPQEDLQVPEFFGSPGGTLSNTFSLINSGSEWFPKEKPSES